MLLSFFLSDTLLCAVLFSGRKGRNQRKPKNKCKGFGLQTSLQVLQMQEGQYAVFPDFWQGGHQRHNTVCEQAEDFLCFNCCSKTSDFLCQWICLFLKRECLQREVRLARHRILSHLRYLIILPFSGFSGSHSVMLSKSRLDIKWEWSQVNLYTFHLYPKKKEKKDF